MALERWLSFSKIRSYIDCPRKFCWQYRKRLVAPVEPSGALVVGNLLHASLHEYVKTRPTDAAAVIECVERATGSLSDPVDENQIEQVRGEVSSHVLAYHEQASDLVGDQFLCEMRLRATLGALTLSSIADVVFPRADDLVVTEYKLSAPPRPLVNLQLTFVHLGLKQRYPQAKIKHLLATFRPKLQIVEPAYFDEAAYRGCISQILGFARQIGEDSSYNPNPGPACNWCPYAEICDATRVDLIDVPF